VTLRNQHEITLRFTAVKSVTPIKTFMMSSQVLLSPTVYGESKYTKQNMIITVILSNQNKCILSACAITLIYINFHILLVSQERY